MNGCFWSNNFAQKIAMKKQLLFISLSLLCYNVSGQVTMATENFDAYAVNQTVATQSPYFSCIGGAAGGSTDALVSDVHAASPTNSMRITNNKDMLYSFSNQTSGRYAIAFKAYFVSQGYINVQHVTQANWAFDLYFNTSNQIMYLNENNPVNGINIGSYSNDTWIDFEFVIDIDLDSVWVYKDGNLAHNDVFHKSTQAGFSTNLGAINFYGLSQFNGVATSNYYIDDFVVLDYSSTQSVSQLSEPSMMIFPNPCDAAASIESEIPMESMTISDVNGRIYRQKKFDSQVFTTTIDALSSGSYFVTIKHEKGTVTKMLMVE